MERESNPMKVLITGAYGLIGNLVYARLAEQPGAYEAYGMVRRLKPSARAEEINFREIPAGQLRLADVSDFYAVQRAVAGMDAATCTSG